jgi:plasmid stability protein
MSNAYIRLEETVLKRLIARARAHDRSPAEQARRYLEIAMAGEDHPDVPSGCVADVLERLAEHKVVVLRRYDPTRN